MTDERLGGRAAAGGGAVPAFPPLPRARLRSSYFASEYVDNH